jgi:hypothetical protein
MEETASRYRWYLPVEGVGETGNVNKVLVTKPEGKRPFGRSRSKGEGKVVPGLFF